MGYATILYVYEDGVERADQSWERWRTVAASLDEAALSVCLGRPAPRKQLENEIAATSERLKDTVFSPQTAPQFERLEHLRQARKGKSIRSAPVGNHMNCVSRCDRVHSGDAGLYLWHGNCLRPLRELDGDELDEVERLLREERERRR